MASYAAGGALELSSERSESERCGLACLFGGRSFTNRSKNKTNGTSAAVEASDPKRLNARRKNSAMHNPTATERCRHVLLADMR